MDKAQEKQIIRALCTAGKEELAKQFARSRGYRVRAGVESAPDEVIDEFLAVFWGYKPFARRGEWEDPYKRKKLETKLGESIAKYTFDEMVDLMVKRGFLKRNKAGAVALSPTGRKRIGK